jgi:hypothetical protein
MTPSTKTLLRRSLLAAVLLTAGPAQALDAGRALERAVDAAREGHHGLARTLLDPVTIAPGLPQEGRALAYHLRGLMFYRDGLYVSAGQDYRRALEFDPTLAAARAALAWLHLHGLGVPRDPREAVRLYRLAARQGHTEARFNLALLLERGTGARPDAAEAVHWFEAAAEDGRVEAMLQAARLLRDGAPRGGLAAEPARAERWLTRAASRGETRAQYELGELLRETDPPRAAGWLQQAAARGFAAAQERLGQLYLEGRGVPEDPERARMWLKEAAKQGDLGAQVRLAWLYDTGGGLAPEPEEALRWYLRAARRDEPTAQLNLGLLYQRGRGTERDLASAAYWLERAAEQGDDDASRALAWLLATADDPRLRDAPRALALVEEAAPSRSDASFLETLAAALAANGRFEDAVAVQEQAITVLADSGGAQAADPQGRARGAELRARLERYRAARPPWADTD